MRMKITPHRILAPSLQLFFLFFFYFLSSPRHCPACKSTPKPDTVALPPPPPQYVLPDFSANKTILIYTRIYIDNPVSLKSLVNTIHSFAFTFPPLHLNFDYRDTNLASGKECGRQPRVCECFECSCVPRMPRTHRIQCCSTFTSRPLEPSQPHMSPNST